MLIKDNTLQSIVSRLSSDDINLLLIAEGTELDIEELIAECNKQSLSIAGGIFPKIIYDEEALDEGIIHKLVGFNQEYCLVEDMSAMDELPELRMNIKSSIVLVDGLSPDIPNFLESLYDKYWNQISYVGGGAGSLTLEQKPCIFSII